VATDPVQLVLLPGLGADRRQFEPQRQAFDNLVVPPWIPPLPREPLAGYAARLAKTITPAGPFILGGSSFGGMVAYEMARHLQPNAVVLIGSCRSARGIRRMFRLLVRCYRSCRPKLLKLRSSCAGQRHGCC
jgi:pimeloyl-ACP methyl ester carboxylesterase